MAIGLLHPQSQPLNQTTSIVATGTDDVFTFPNPPTGLTWTGTLTVAPVVTADSTPTGATFTATIGATNWGEWGGATVYGPVQCLSSQQLLVTCVGLTAGIAYLCIWTGSSDPSGVVQPLYPAANSTALTALIQSVPPGLVSGPTTEPTGTNYDQTLAMPAGTRTLIVVATPTASFVPILTVVGESSNYLYYDQDMYLGAIGGSYFSAVKVNPAVDSSYTVSVSSEPGNALTVTVSADPEAYDDSAYYNGVVQTARVSLTAAGSMTVLQGPARLLGLEVRTTATDVTAIIAGSEVAFATSTEGAQYLTFPSDTILAAAETVAITQVGAGASPCTVTFAYP